MGVLEVQAETDGRNFPCHKARSRRRDPANLTLLSMRSLSASPRCTAVIHTSGRHEHGAHKSRQHGARRSKADAALVAPVGEDSVHAEGAGRAGEQQVVARQLRSAAHQGHGRGGRRQRSRRAGEPKLPSRARARSSKPSPRHDELGCLLPPSLRDSSVPLLAVVHACTASLPRTSRAPLRR